MKPLAQLGGRPLVDYPVSALRQAGAEPVLAVGSPDDSTRLALEAMNLMVIDDHVTGAGPAAGVLAALDHAPTEIVVVLACDTPLVTPATIVGLVRAIGSTVDAAVAVADGKLQPLIAAYRTSARRAFEFGAPLHRGLDALTVMEVPLDADVATNVNTSADLDELRRRSTWPEGGGR